MDGSVTAVGRPGEAVRLCGRDGESILILMIEALRHPRPAASPPPPPPLPASAYASPSLPPYATGHDEEPVR
ncbi:hypothetical protein AMK23_14800 [Streptomyces sp. CB02130]|nr:hypothetical protein AMK23_14800 [Streptomyces sp. CB02130]